MVVLLSLLVFTLVLPDVDQLCLLFHFEDGLFHSLVEEHVKDWLHLSVIVKQIIIPNLGGLVDACLLWHILGGGRLLQEVIGLALDVHLFRNGSVLLSQEQSEVNFDAGLRKRS